MRDVIDLQSRPAALGDLQEPRPALHHSILIGTKGYAPLYYDCMTKYSFRIMRSETLLELLYARTHDKMTHIMRDC